MTLLDPLPAALQSWQNFYILTGTAAATLLGLMFVAVTFGSSLVTKETSASARAFIDPIYLHFAQVLLTAVILMIPTLGPTFLGSLIIVVAGVRTVGLLPVLHHYREAHRQHGDIELSDWMIALVLPLLCHLLLVACGVGVLTARLSLALTGLAVVNILLLVIAIQGAWELLVWMALAVSERSRNGRGPA
jgi:hypothetical protein